MLPKGTLIFLVLSVLPLTSAKCPEPEGLPTLFKPGVFMCARLYSETSHVKMLACKTNHPVRDVANGELTRDSGRWNDWTSAIVVRPGCVLTGFLDGQFSGGMHKFKGVYSNLIGGWGDRMSSWTCECNVPNEALTCTPRQESTMLKICNNPSSGKMVCTHSVAKGMQIGKSTTRGQSSSHTVTASVGAVIKKVFSVGLSYSHTTSFNWSQTESSVFSDVTTSTVKCEVEPHKSIKMMTVVGKCGDVVVHTGSFSCIPA